MTPTSSAGWICKGSFISGWYPFQVYERRSRARRRAHLPGECRGLHLAGALELEPGAIDAGLREPGKECKRAVVSVSRVRFVGMTVNERNTVLMNKHQMRHRAEIRLQVRDRPVRARILHGERHIQRSAHRQLCRIRDQRYFQ